MDKYCKDRKCLASDNQGYLITYDNSHLTKEGAIFLSRKFNFNDMVINDK